jgi:hypothetical protein
MHLDMHSLGDFLQRRRVQWAPSGRVAQANAVLRKRAGPGRERLDNEKWPLIELDGVV